MVHTSSLGSLVPFRLTSWPDGLNIFDELDASFSQEILPIPRSKPSLTEDKYLTEPSNLFFTWDHALSNYPSRILPRLRWAGTEQQANLQYTQWLPCRLLAGYFLACLGLVLIEIVMLVRGLKRLELNKTLTQK